ncbi:MAG TPA: sigma-70 family RNA polymerase sigma factor [Nocardioidaceae bacterium]|nr:sigma-70 family RNA polymerase sigma factor [Nocardioidaceae bacterium]
MTELLSRVEAPSDAELISRVRGGDVSAYGELFSRHVDAARRLGRQLVRGTDVDDLVSDAFAKTLQVLQSGGGPDVAFRAYLLTSVRRLHVDRIRAAKRVQPSDDMTAYDDGVPFQDTAIANFENGAAAKAFSSLPERWQLVLWHLEVEGQKPADIAPLLGMSANSVSALAYRAREGLRQAFLTMHLADSPTEECRWVNEHLGAYVRKGLSRRDTTKVEQHLDGCRRCTAMYLELSEVNSNLAGIIAPLILGAAAAGYISSAGTAGLSGLSALIGRVRDSLGSQPGGGAATTTGSATTGTATTGGTAISTGAVTSGAATTGAITTGVITTGAVTTGGMITAGGVIAAGVAAVTTAALVLGGGGGREALSQADRPMGVVQHPGGQGSGDTAGRPAGQDKAGSSELGGLPAGSTRAGGNSWIVGEGGRPNTSESDTAGVGDGTGPWYVNKPAPVGDNQAPGADNPAAGGDPVPGPGTGPAPDPGTGGDTQPGTGSDPGSGPGTDPGTADPGGSNDPGTGPGTGDPGTDPGTSDPGGSTDPGTEPGTGGSGTGDPGGSGDPAVISATLTVTGGDTVVDGAVAFSLKGNPALPATVKVSLDSKPGGITFQQEGPCTRLDGTTVTCTTTPQMLNSLVSGIPMVGDGAVTYVTALPLDIPQGQEDTDLSLTVTSADDHVLGSAEPYQFSYKAPQVTPPGEEDGPFAIATGSDPVATPVKDGEHGQHLYDLTVTFKGVKNGGRLDLKLTHPADAFQPSDGWVVSDDRQVATRTLEPGPNRLTVNLVARLPGSLQGSTIEATFEGETKTVTLNDPVGTSGATLGAVNNQLLAAAALFGSRP